MSRYPTGRRVSLQINPELATVAVHSLGVRARFEAMVDEIASLADATCPVGTEDEHLPPGHDPGALKGSQRHAVLDTPAGLLGVVAYMAWWAHFVHNGTVHSTANPWLMNAALHVLVRSRA